MNDIMKKILVVLLSGLMISTLMTGCNSGNDNKITETSEISQTTSDTESTEIDFDSLNAKYVQCFIDEDFGILYSECIDEVKKQLTQEQLKSAWEQVVSDIGEYKSINKTENLQQGDYKVYTTTLEFEKTGVIVILSFDKNGKVAGLNLNYVTITSDELEESETAIEVGEYKLKGVVNNAGENAPVVIMIQGSGQSDYNESIATSPNKPFKEISDYLYKNGITTIRYNKRYFEKPETAPTDMTVYDEYIDDVNWLIDYADKNFSGDIYLLGHSQGGMSVSKIAHDNDKVKGIISMAGSPRPFEDIIYDQNVESINLMDCSQEEKDAYLKTVKDEVELVKNMDCNTKDAYFNISKSYWKSFNELDCAKYSEELTIPMLIMQGKADFQVSYEKDYLLWKDILKGKDNVVFKEYDALNHMFMPTLYDGAFNMDEYSQENHIDENVLKDIAEFINK